MSQKVTGVIAAMVTPCSPDGATVDGNALPGYLEFLIAAGVDGLFIGGTTGEGPVLQCEEKISLFHQVVEAVAQRVGVIAHVGDVSTRQAVRLAIGAAEAGADAVAAVTPYFYHYDDEAIYDYYKAIADAVPQLPLYAYNIPQNAGNLLSSRLYGMLAATLPSFAGVKTSSPDLMLLGEYLHCDTVRRTDVFVGCDGLDLAGLVCGARGIVSGNCSAFPEPFVRLMRAITDADFPLARKIQSCIDELRKITYDGRKLAIYKEALKLRGVPVGGVRAPLRPLPADEREELNRRIRDWSERWEVQLNLKIIQ